MTSGRKGKVCITCGLWKRRSLFYRKPTAADGRHSECKVCLNKRTALWQRVNPEKFRRANAANAQHRRDAGKTLDSDLRSKYGITEVDYNRTLAEQGGRCAICRRKPEDVIENDMRRLAVDHDHETGKVRGLLCTSCNTALGFLQESPEIIQAAADYAYRWVALHNQKRAQ